MESTKLPNAFLWSAFKKIKKTSSTLISGYNAILSSEWMNFRQDSRSGVVFCLSLRSLFSVIKGIFKKATFNCDVVMT